MPQRMSPCSLCGQSENDCMKANLTLGFPLAVLVFAVLMAMRHEASGLVVRTTVAMIAFVVLGVALKRLRQ